MKSIFKKRNFYFIKYLSTNFGQKYFENRNKTDYCDLKKDYRFLFSSKRRIKAFNSISKTHFLRFLIEFMLILSFFL